MLDAGARAIGSFAGHLMLCPAHGVAHFAGQGLALSGGQDWNRPQANQHLHAENHSRYSIHLHPRLSPLRSVIVLIYRILMPELRYRNISFSRTTILAVWVKYWIVPPGWSHFFYFF